MARGKLVSLLPASRSEAHTTFSFRFELNFTICAYLFPVISNLEGPRECWRLISAFFVARSACLPCELQQFTRHMSNNYCVSGMWHTFLKMLRTGKTLRARIATECQRRLFMTCRTSRFETRGAHLLFVVSCRGSLVAAEIALNFYCFQSREGKMRNEAHWVAL